MAQNAPPSQDVQHIQFKLHDNLTVFPEGKYAKSLVSLLAVSAAKGLLFAGNPNSMELKVFKLRDVVDSKTAGGNIKVRVINLPGEPKVLACSCDGSLLAVNYISNSTGFLQIYHVDSFVATNLNCLYNLPVAPDNNIFALQLLWNPVIANNIALVLTDGSVAIFTLNNGGQYDKVTLGKEHQVRSGCWSPKGKQIVFGFAEGKLQQFKPNLQPARAIPCPAAIYPGPFDCIALHWLSTFQFAAIFLQRGQDMCPSLFIINAPKTGQPSYINYYDICYSAPGPRIQQLAFNYIAQWNILLVISANGVEVGVLGTNETGETPNWMQYTLLDEARIEMPLNASKDETYPIGFALDTSSSHQVVIGEKKFPVMPMIHVLSTHGHLVSYNFLNLSPNAVDICSPPPPLNDISGQFVPLSNTFAIRGSAEVVPPAPVITAANASEINGLNKPPQNAGQQSFNDMTFNLSSSAVTSTPTLKDKPLPSFGPQTVAPKSATGFGFPTSVAAAPAPTTPNATAAINKPSTVFAYGAATELAANSQQLGGMTTGTPFAGFAGTGFTTKTSEPNNPPTIHQPTAEVANVNKSTEINKPLYTVPPNFTPPDVTQQQPSKMETKVVKPVASASNKINLNNMEIDEVVKQMIVIQMEAFETELRHIRQQSKQLMANIGSPNEIKNYTKHLNDLQEIIEQANNHEFEEDVQSLRHSMNESYAMLAECRTKLDLYNNPDLNRLSTVTSTDAASRRQLAKLQVYVASNQNQMSVLNQLIDAQWSQYQDIVRRNTRNQMHIPCLDGIYQRMSKLKDLLSRQRTKMNYIQTKLRQKGLNYKPDRDANVTSTAVGALLKNQSIMESLADSILSISLSQVVSQTHAKLSEEKLNAIRNFTRTHHKITIIKPKRPDRVGLKSEVILETKLETERKQKEMAKKQQQLQQYLQQQQQQQLFAAYKAAQINVPTTSKHQQQQHFPAHLQQQILKPQANLSSTSQQQQQQTPILVKPTASKPIVSSQPHSFITPTSSTGATLSFVGNSSFVKTSVSASKPEETSKPLATSTPFAGFGMSMTQAQLNFNQQKPAVIGNDSKENKPPSAPISFSAKVIAGNDTKSFANLGGSKTPAIQSKAQGFPAAASTGFSAFTTTKPATQTSNQDKDGGKKTEEAPKPFSFNTASTTTTTASTLTPAAFTGFAATTKSATTTAPFATSVFSSNNITTTATPFAALSSSSSFSFNANVTTTAAPSATPTAAANSSTKVATTAAISSAQPATVVIAKPTETKATASTTANTSATSTPASNAAANPTASIIKSSAAPNVTITTSGLTEAKQATATTATSSNTPLSATQDPTDSLLDSLNICKPIAKEAGGDSNKSGNIFSGFAAANPSTAASVAPFTFVSSTSTTGGSTAFSFVAAASSTPTPDNIFSKPVTAASVAATPATETTRTSSTLSTIGTTNAVTISKAESPTTTATTTSTKLSLSFVSSDPSTASTTDSIFDSFSLSSSETASVVAAPATNTSSAAAGNVFAGASSFFGQATTAATTSTTSSIFGGGAAVGSSAPSLFASTAPTATTAATPGSIFAAAAATSPTSAGSIFAGIPKPEQTVFDAANTPAQPAGTNLFATAAANTQPSAATGGSIFSGGSSTGFLGSTGGSIFGGGNAAASNPFSSAGGSLFASAATANNSAEGVSIFSSPTQQSPTSGGSIFCKSNFGATPTPQSAGSIFGGGNTQSPTSGGFGATGGSIFTGSTAANTSVSGGSLFGPAVTASAPGFGSNTAASPGFGSFSQPTAAASFGSPSSAGGFGAPASAGFGSPQQQSAFAKPIFGGPATFGSPQPTFGAQPTFGGAPTFGSPKGFGSFAATSPNASGFNASNQGSAVPKGNIFETLGSQDSGLSFGNLAHSTQAPQPKPSFGGSSFMNYRS